MHGNAWDKIETSVSSDKRKTKEGDRRTGRHALQLRRACVGSRIAFAKKNAAFVYLDDVRRMKNREEAMALPDHDHLSACVHASIHGSAGRQLHDYRAKR